MSETKSNPLKDTREEKALVGDSSRELLKKLHNIMIAVDSIPKNGYNKKQDYKYAMESDVLEAFRKELIKENVFITSSLITSDAKPEGWGILTTVSMQYVIHDLDSGETLSVSFAGQGMDGGDKGIYKAYTGANKYFLLKTFWLPTYDDPEKDTKEQAPQTDTELATDAYIKRLNVLVTEREVEYGLSCEIDEKIRNGVLTQGEAKEYGKQLNKLPKLGDTTDGSK